MRRLAVVLAGLVALAACASDEVPAGPSVTFAPVPTTQPPAATTTAGPTSTTAPTSTTVATTAGTTSTADTTTTAPTATTGPSACCPPPAQAVQVASVDAPTGIAVRPGDDRVFVVSRPGQIVPVGPDGTVGSQVLDIRPLVTAGGEQGLLGLAFHPSEPLAYVDYTGTDGGNTHIDEYAVASDGTLDPSSRRQVLEIDQPFANHNGGQLAFGPDGDLYIGMGDGGSGGDPQRRALNVGQLLGKILRIDPRASGDQPYSVPADNPFVGVAGAHPEIWSVGLRNPWRFSFDPSTNDLWIADVGQNQWEEIDVAWADEGGGRGANFGWSAFEGSHRYNQDQPTQGAIPPFFEYEHGDAGCSISGGALYRGAAIPSLDGWYVYADYCAGEVLALEVVDRRAGRQVSLGRPGAVSSITAGPDGELYVTSVDDDALLRIVPT